VVARKILTLTIILTSGTTLFCQNRENVLSRSFSFAMDNDIYFVTDYYYTAGAKINYRRLVSENTKLFKLLTLNQSDSSRLIIDYNFGSKIFNPRSIRFNDSKTTDRPYAGYSYAGFNLARFNSPTKGISASLELGVVGENTGLGQLQRWWHRQTHFLVPKGWDSQIANELIVNLNFRILRSVALARGVDLISQTGLNAGTGLNQLSQDFTIRFLRFNSISTSDFLSANLSWEKSDKLNKEFFLFAGLGLAYTFSNIFIEGSLFEFNTSPFTVNAVPVVVRSNMGLMYSRNRYSFSMTIHHLSKEVEKGISHTYGALAFGYRF